MASFRYLLLLHVVAIHTSIAAMEVISWLLFALVTFQFLFRKSTWKEWGPALWLVGFAAIATIGVVVSGSGLSSALAQIGFLRWMLLLYSFAFAWSHSKWLDDPQKLLWVWFGIAALAGIYTTFQFATGINLVRPHHQLRPAESYGFRPTGFFSLTLTMSYVVGISLSFLLPQLSLKKLDWRKILLWFFILCGLLTSLTRGAWLAFTVAIVVYAFQKQGWRAFFTLIPLGMLLTLLVMFEPDINSRSRALLDFSSNASSGMRVDLWRAYWAIFLDNPVLGVGLFNPDDMLLETYRRLGIQQDFVSHAHNNYLQVLAGTGSLGFIAFVGFNAYFLKLSWQLERHFRALRPQLARLAQGALLAQVFWQIGGLTECNFFDGEVNHSIVFIWALLLAMKFIAGESRSAQHEQ